MRTRVKAFFGIEYGLFLFLFFYLVKRTTSFAWQDVIFFILILLISDSINSLDIAGKNIAVSICLPLLIPAMAILNPLEVGLIAMIGVSNIINTKKRKWYKTLFNMTLKFIAASIGVMIFQLVQTYLGQVYLSLFIGSLTYYFINNGLVFWGVWLCSSNEDDDIGLVSYFYQISKSFIVLYSLGMGFYYLQIYFSRLVIILAIILLYVLKDLIFSRMQQLNSFTQIVESFLKVIDSKDHYTEGHCERVAEYTTILCKEMKMIGSKKDRIVNMAKIHDIGKIYVDDRILKSSDLLSSDDYEEMQKHSYYGYELLKDIDIMKKDLNMILHHHEHYNGAGYPDGITGEDIPLGARIICICDSFDVMITGRSYKPHLSKEEIITEIEDCSGKHFDPELARLMLKLIRSGRFDNYLEKVKGKQLFERLKLKFDGEI